MMHTNKKGESKLLKKCTLPITGVKCVKKVVTNLAVLEITPNDGFRLLERAPGISVEEIKNAKESPILVSEEQKDARINEIKKTALSDIYSDSERARLKGRLEEMAYVFLKSEEEEYAQFSLAAALSLDEKDSILVVNLFLMALMDRTLDLYARATTQADRPDPEEKAEEPGSIIIP